MAKKLSQKEFDTLVKVKSLNIEGCKYITIDSAILHEFVKDNGEDMASKFDNKYGTGFRIGHIWASFSDKTPIERRSYAFNSEYMKSDKIFIDTKLDVENKLIFYKTRVEPYDLNEFLIKSNNYLHSEIKGFYHTDYKSYQTPGNPDFLNVLKNQYNSTSPIQLESASIVLKNVLSLNLPIIKEKINHDTLTVVLAPRAKACQEEWYQQLRKAVSEWCVEHTNEGFEDGCNYIIRHTDTPTTHLGEEGEIYPGIIKDTCRISSNIAGKQILFIDDIYTYGVNIDEDCLQTIMDNNPASLTFYSVAKTLKKEE